MLVVRVLCMGLCIGEFFNLLDRRRGEFES